MGVTLNFEDLLILSKTVEGLTLPVLKENNVKIIFQDFDANKTEIQWESPPLPFAESEVFYANICESRRLTASGEDCKDVYEVVFDITGSNIQFKPGDTIGIIPQNKEGEVNKILSHLGLETQADLQYELKVDKTIKGNKLPSHVPVQSTLGHVLKCCFDLRCALKKLFLLALSKYTKDENERRVLEYICSKEGSASYTTHILGKNICLIDLLDKFPSCKPPIEVLLTNLPKLLPRPYSVANSSIKNPNKVRICFSVMDIGNNRKGLVTGWLEDVILKNTDFEHRIKNLSLNDGQCENFKIPIYLRKNVSGFSMPNNLQTPLLLLGPGTGVAPFIGFLEERECLKEKDPSLNLGETWLFFGCRNPKLDFIYEKELKRFESNGSLSRLSTAFSRIEDCRKYVQDVLLENGKEVAKFITKGASVYICGDINKMAAQIKDALVQCLVKYDGKTKEDAEKCITDMQKEKKYIVDAWS